MPNPIYIPKDDAELPDKYGIEITYFDNKVETFEIASHTLDPKSNILHIVTHDDYFEWYPMQSVKKVRFDKNFSKMVALKEKKDRENAQNNNSSVGVN